MNLYVSNLPARIEDTEVRAIFEKFGEVSSIQIMRNNSSGLGKGYGFITMASGGRDAIAALNGTLMKGKRLIVNEAVTDRSRRDSGYN